MKYRKTVYLILGPVLALSVMFAACSKQSESGSGERAATTTTLNLWHIYNDQSRGVPIEEACRRFEAANPGVKIAISINANDPYKTKLKTVSAEDFPDVFHSWGGGWLKSFVDAGYVADMTADANAVMSQLNPAAVNFNNFDGKIWGVPYIIGSTHLFYNKVMFNQYGLQPPETFADLENICTTLLANNITPFAEANKTQWPGAQHFVFLAMRLGGGDIFTRAQNREVPFTDPAFIRAGEMLIDMVDKGWFPSGVNGLDWDTGQSRMLFYTGQCGMILQTGGMLGTVVTENKDFYDNNLGVAMYPAIEGSPGKATDMLAGENAWSVAAKSKNLEMAKKLAIFLAIDQKVQQDMIDNGITSSKPGLEITDPNLQTAMDHIARATYMQNYVDQTISPEMADVHKSTVQALFGKTMTPQQAADTMQQTFDAAL